MGEQVIGHYVPAGQEEGSSGWQAALAQSTDLFRALVSDDLTAFEKHLGSLGPSAHSSWHTVLFWSAPPHTAAAAGEDEAPGKVEAVARSRTLAMLATQHGSVRVLSYLLSSGADPTTKAKDGADCYTVMDEAHPNAASIRGMLNDAAGNWPASTSSQQHPGSSQHSAPGTAAAGACGALIGNQQQAATQQQDGSVREGGPQEEQAAVCDLTRPEYSTDWFRMYCFKVLRCSKRYAHDWRACPFAHPTENARRRDPREFTYSSLVCPDYRQGCCVRGDTCQYAHGVFESWLHPSRYRTQLCKDTQKCDRVVCFFAHSLDELRTPESSFVPGPEERLRVPEPMQAVLGIAPPAGLPQLQVSGLDTAHAPDQNTQLELMLQQQQQGMVSSSSNSALNRAASSNTSFGSSGQVPAGAPAGDDQQQQQHQANGSSAADVAAASSSAAGQPSPKPQQLVSPTALPMPRMSNAFARKHGLDPKENPLVNLQRLAMQQQASPQQQAAAMGAQPPSGRRGKRGGGGQQGYPPQPPYSPQPQFQQQQQQHYQQHPYQQHYQQQSAGHPSLLLQPLSLQPPQQLLQPGMLSPAAAAAYYGSPSPMQQLQASPASPMLDPNAMALLFGGMGIGQPLSPVDPTGAMAAAAAGMASPQFGMPAYAMGVPSPSMAGQAGAGMLSPLGAAAMLSPVPDHAGGLGGQSPLPPPLMHRGSALHSPY